MLSLTHHDNRLPFFMTEPTEIVVVDVELEYGKMIAKCKAKSDDSTPVRIRWLKDDVEIPYNINPIAVNSIYFLLDNVNENGQDQGASHKYTCIASNGYSEARASAFLRMPREYLMLLVTWDIFIPLTSHKS